MADETDVKPILLTALSEQPRLTVTQESKKGSKHACSICGKGFLYSSRLEKHLKEHLSIVKEEKEDEPQHPLQCRIVALDSKRGSKHACTVCGKGFLYTSMLEKHVKEHHSVVKEEKEDGEKDASKIDLSRKSFMTISGLGLQRPLIWRGCCSTCDFQSYSKKALRIHELGHLQPQKDTCTPQALPLFTCATCGLGFNRRPEFASHVKSHGRRCKICGSESARDLCAGCFEKQGQPYNCRICGWAFSQRGNMLRHEMLHHKVTACGVCGETFRMRKSLLSHAVSHIGDVAPFGCPICRAGFDRKEDVLSHFRTHTEIEGESHKEGLHHCRHCGQTFHERKSLIKHAISHVGEAPFCCPICHKSFEDREDVILHVRIHTGEEPTPELRAHEKPHEWLYLCRHCCQTFRLRKSLLKHAISHVGDPPFSCLVCHTSFEKKEDILSHFPAHTGEEPLSQGNEWLYLCRHCGLTFHSRKALLRHAISHVGETPFCCPMCHKSFDEREDIISHFGMHTGEETPTPEVKDQEWLYLCRHCGKTFQYRRALLKHAFKHVGDVALFSCPICYMSFEKKEDILSHFPTHTGEEPVSLAQWLYLCRHCGQTYQYRKALLKHAIPHVGETPFCCPVCHKSFDEREDVLKHFRTHTGEETPTAEVKDQEWLYLCRQCGKTFQYRRALLKHAIKHVGDVAPFSCPICRLGFDHEKEDVLAHLRTHEEPRQRSRREPRPQELHHCRHCGMNFRYRSVLRSHVLKHTGEQPHGCPLCKMRFALKGSLKSHLLSHTGERPHLCDVCGKGFATAYRLRCHERTHTGERPYACGTCGGTFRLPGTLRTHMVLVHGAKRRKNGTRAAPNPRKSAEYPESTISANCLERAKTEIDLAPPRQKFRYKCSHCPYSGKTSSRLSEHLQTHSGERSYRCELCNRGFVHRRGLMKHQVFHTGDFPHCCPVCQKGFTAPTKLRQHLQSKHPEHELPQEPEVFKCLVCKKRYKNAVTLKAHRTKSGHLATPPPPTFRCSECPHVARSSSALVLHLRTHSGERPHHCELCGKGFAQKSTLKSHLRTHTGERPCACAECGKKFSSLSAMRRHERRMHSDGGGESKPQRCHLCPKAYTEKSSLLIHLRMHTGERPFKCDTCGSAFRQSTNLTRHQKTHHREEVVTVHIRS